MSTWNQTGQQVHGDQYNAENVYASQDSPEQLLTVGRRALSERLYRQAVEHLEQAIARGVPDADAFYYLALAYLGGQKPSRWGADAPGVVKRVEEQLRRALDANHHSPHVYALWAAVRRDYYQGRVEPEPSSDVLASRAEGIDPLHVAEIAPFFDTPGDAHWTIVKSAAQRSTAERRPTVHRYFMPVPRMPAMTGPQLMMAFGGILLLFAVIAFTMALADPERALLMCPAFLGAGFGVFLGGKGALRYFNARSAYERALAASTPRPTDEQMDRWFSLDKFAIMDSALRTLDRSVQDLICEPQMIIGPASPSQQAVGHDRVRRFSRYKFVVMLLGERRVSVYSCEWDFINCVISNADAFDFRYSDITGIRMRQPHDATAGNTLVLINEDGSHTEISPSKIFEMIIAGTDRIAVIINVEHENPGSVQQPTGAAAAEKLIRRQLDSR